MVSSDGGHYRSVTKYYALLLHYAYVLYGTFGRVNEALLLNYSRKIVSTNLCVQKLNVYSLYNSMKIVRTFKRVKYKGNAMKLFTISRNIMI